MSLDGLEQQKGKHSETYGSFMSEVMGTRDNGNMPFRKCSSRRIEQLLPCLQITNAEDVNLKDNALEAQSEHRNAERMSGLQISI